MTFHSRRRFASALVAAVALAAAAAFAAPAPERYAFGVLRPDGILVPFASYDNGKWGSNWPLGLVGVEIPIGMADVPARWFGPPGAEGPWKAWINGATGSRERDLALVKPVQIPIFCMPRLAILTDYRGKPAEPGPTQPKDGLAVAGGAAVDRIETVSKFAPEWKRVTDLIAEKFARAENRAAYAFTNWKHPYDEAHRRQFPIQLESMYRASDATKRGTWATSYVEAVRKFPPGPFDKGCGLITYAYGWIREQAGKPAEIDLAAKVAYCDREGVPFMAPLGRLRLDDEVYWVYQLSSWRDEMYVISRVRPDEVKPIVAVTGGMCGRQQIG